MVEVGDEHFYPNETQHRRQTVTQIDKLVDNTRQQKVQTAKAQNRKDIAGVDDKRFLRNRKDSRDAVDGKDQVGNFDQYQNE